MKVQKIKRDVNDRTGIIGGSSIGAVLGLSTYKSSHDVWEDFTGVEKPPVDEKTQEIFDMGHELEGFIAKQTERIFGVKLKASNFAYVHPQYDWLICHPDRIMVGKDESGNTIGVEIKSSSVYDNGRWGDADTSEIPMDYLCQCHSYMMCGVCDKVWLIRFSNNRLTRYIVEKDEETEDMILSQLVTWVHKVNSGWEPPYTDYKDACSKFKGATNDDIEATAEINDIVEELRAQQKIEKEAHNKTDALKAQIVSFIGDSKKKYLMYRGKKLGSFYLTEYPKIDEKALKEAEPKIFDKYSKTVSFMQFR